MLRNALLAASIFAAASIGGCASNEPAPPVRTNFLSTYKNLEQVSDTTWRYLNTAEIAKYNRFFVPEARVFPAEGARAVQTTWGDLNMAREYLQQTVINHLSEGGYEVVQNPGPGVAEVRLALTEAFDAGNRVGLNIEAELLDSLSTIQMGALLESQMGQNLTLTRFWTEHDAKAIMDSSQRFRDRLDEIHGR
ncbi:MAG: DUF3313 family protein [Planctomycetota bacterium]|jgi:hypothetical protein